MIAFLSSAAWPLPLCPTLASALTIAAVALVYNSATREDNSVTRDAAWPKYW